MSPSTKSYLCATVAAVVAAWVFAHYWQTLAGSIAFGAVFWIALILFSRMFGVPNRPSKPS